jgi:hypothetical protein
MVDFPFAAPNLHAMSTTSLLPRPMFFHEFEPLVGQTFLADCTPRPAELELVEARPIRSSGAIPRPQFTLIFRSTPSVFLVAGVYMMRCGPFGPELIYIAPTLPPPDASGGDQFYQAAFS